MTSSALAPTALAAPVLIMTSFSLWRHSLLSWPRPALQTYGHLTAFNIQRYIPISMVSHSSSTETSQQLAIISTKWRSMTNKHKSASKHETANFIMLSLTNQGDHSFSTMIFHDFSMTFPWPKNEFPWPISTAYFSKRNMRSYTARNKMPLWYQTTNGNIGKSEGQTMNNVHFYKIPGHHRHFPWFSITFHDLGCFPWLSRPGKWSY